MEPHLKILHTVSETVSRTLDVEEILKTALEALTHVTGHEIASLHLVATDGMTLEYSFGMEEFPAEGARKPRVMEPIKASIDYWDSFLDPRKATVGAIERMEAAPAQIAAE